MYPVPSTYIWVSVAGTVSWPKIKDAFLTASESALYCRLSLQTLLQFACSHRLRCTFYTYIASEEHCLLFENHTLVEDACSGSVCVSGQPGAQYANIDEHTLKLVVSFTHAFIVMSICTLLGLGIKVLLINHALVYCALQNVTKAQVGHNIKPTETKK